MKVLADLEVTSKEVERTAEAEERDPKRAIVAAMFDGVRGVHLHGPTPLAFIKALVKEDRDPKRRPYRLKKRQRASPSDTIGPVVRSEPAAPTPHTTPAVAPPANLGDRDKRRDTNEYEVIDGEEYYLPRSEIFTCWPCDGTGLAYLRGKRAPCIDCDGSGSVVYSPSQRR